MDQNWSLVRFTNYRDLANSVIYNKIVTLKFEFDNMCEKLHKTKFW